MEESMLDIISLEKAYGKNQVIKGISLSIKKGQVFGLLGINGAGKTTLLEIIEGLRNYQKGEVILLGENIANPNTHKRLCQKIGVQLQLASFPEQMKVKEIAEVVYVENNKKYNQSVLSSLGLLEHANKKYGELSTGLKRRLHLMLALVNEPELLILDEPTAGLDLQGRAELHAEILKLKKKGKTIILSSHDSAEIEKLCDAIGIIKDGKLEYYKSIEDFKLQKGKHVGELSSVCFCADNEIVEEEILDFFSEYEVEMLDKRIKLSGNFSMNTILSDIIKFLEMRNLQLVWISSTEGSFEETLQNSLREG